MSFIRENSVSCPKCNQAIIKSDGCNKMVCGTCAVSFSTSITSWLYFRRIFVFCLDELWTRRIRIRILTRIIRNVSAAFLKAQQSTLVWKNISTWFCKFWLNKISIQSSENTNFVNKTRFFFQKSFMSPKFFSKLEKKFGHFVDFFGRANLHFWKAFCKDF